MPSQNARQNGTALHLQEPETLQVRGLSPAQLWDYENGFYWFSDPKRLGKCLAHYELYKRVLGLAGDIFELGVYKATSLTRFATFRELFENSDSRRIVAFDAFGEFPTERIDSPGDKKFIREFESAGGHGLSTAEVQAILDHKRISQNVDLVQGDIRVTIPEFLERRAATRIALLHLDLDVYEPTKFALDALWDRVVPGGLVVLDDYNAVEGATEAVDEFARAHKIGKIEKLGCAHAPAFIVKQNFA